MRLEDWGDKIYRSTPLKTAYVKDILLKENEIENKEWEIIFTKNIEKKHYFNLSKSTAVKCIIYVEIWVIEFIFCFCANCYLYLNLEIFVYNFKYYFEV